MPSIDTEIDMPMWCESIESDGGGDLILMHIRPSPQSSKTIALPMSTQEALQLIQGLSICVETQKRRNQC